MLLDQGRLRSDMRIAANGDTYSWARRKLEPRLAISRSLMRRLARRGPCAEGGALFALAPQALPSLRAGSTAALRYKGSIPLARCQGMRQLAKPPGLPGSFLQRETKRGRQISAFAHAVEVPSNRPRPRHDAVLQQVSSKRSENRVRYVARDLQPGDNSSLGGGRNRRIRRIQRIGQALHRRAKLVKIAHCGDPIVPAKAGRQPLFASRSSAALIPRRGKLKVPGRLPCRNHRARVISIRCHRRGHNRQIAGWRMDARDSEPARHCPARIRRGRFSELVSSHFAIRFGGARP